MINYWKHETAVQSCGFEWDVLTMDVAVGHCAGSSIQRSGFNANLRLSKDHAETWACACPVETDWWNHELGINFRFLWYLFTSMCVQVPPAKYEKEMPSKKLLNSLNFGLSRQISIAEPGDEFICFGTSTFGGNSDYPCSDKARPTCNRVNPLIGEDRFCCTIFFGGGGFFQKAKQNISKQPKNKPGKHTNPVVFSFCFVVCWCVASICKTIKSLFWSALLEHVEGN